MGERLYYRVPNWVSTDCGARTRDILGRKEILNSYDLEYLEGLSDAGVDVSELIEAILKYKTIEIKIES